MGVVGHSMLENSGVTVRSWIVMASFCTLTTDHDSINKLKQTGKNETHSGRIGDWGSFLPLPLHLMGELSLYRGK